MAKNRRTLTERDLALIADAQLAAVLSKVKRGQVLTAREQQILDRARAVPDNGKPGTPELQSLEEHDGEGPIWLPPSEFLRWLQEQGITLSRKSLYKTYYGTGARHPVHVSPDGKRIHKWKALELIRIVQGGEGAGDSARIITERQQADARFRTAKARQAELELEEIEGKRVPLDTIERVWATMWENVKNEARALEHNLPEELDGKSKGEMRGVLSLALHRMFAHLATSCRDQVKNLARKPA